MDPLSQGVIGASLSQSFSNNKNIFFVFIVGFLSGVFPDIDIFFRSNHDPLLFLEFHRQFTHSLIFIPLGGFIFTLIFYGLFFKLIPFGFLKTWLFSTMGYATHGLLDACTSYGTQLLWPFSNERISWNNISIIDPLFTIPVLIFLLLSLTKRRSFWAKIALGWALIYLVIGFIQNHRAEQVANEIVTQRNHHPEIISVKPSFGNLILWKIIYQHNGYFYIDAVNIGPKKEIFTGHKIKKFNKSDLSYLDDLSDVQKKDIDRFLWFSQDFVSINPRNQYELLDIRYSNLPNEIGGLWGIHLNPNTQSHVEFISNRSLQKRDFKQFFQMIFNGYFD
jgi:inner membrane protein